MDYLYMGHVKAKAYYLTQHLLNPLRLNAELGSGECWHSLMTLT